MCPSCVKLTRLGRFASAASAAGQVISVFLENLISISRFVDPFQWNGYTFYYPCNALALYNKTIKQKQIISSLHLAVATQLITSPNQVIPLDKEGRPVGNHTYVKTGLLGFTNSAGSVFVSGTVAGMIKLGGRVHNSEDVRATVLAVEPPSFVHRLRVAIFAVSFIASGVYILTVANIHFRWFVHEQSTNRLPN